MSPGSGLVILGGGDSKLYLVDPSVCLEADAEANGEEEAGVPVDQDQDVHHNLQGVA